MKNDKIGYTLSYNTGLKEETKNYALIGDMLNDTTLPQEASFDFSKRMYSPSFKVFGYSIYTDRFHLIGNRFHASSLQQVKKRINFFYSKEEIRTV